MDDTVENKDEITRQENEEENTDVDADDIIGEENNEENIIVDADECGVDDSTDSKELQEVEEPEIQVKLVGKKSAKPQGGFGIDPW